MDAIYQATDKDISFFETKVKELDAERNQSTITSILQSLQVQGTKLEDSKLLVSHQCQ